MQTSADYAAVCARACRYVEVALGLLSEPVAVELLLQTAEIDAASADTAQLVAAKTICKGAGYLPLCVIVI